MIDVDNANGGADASFCVMSTYEGFLEIDGLHVRVDPDAIPAGLDLTCAQAYGIHIAPTLSGVEAKVANVHVAGYYRKFPTEISGSLSTTDFRDWGSPNLPPADTANQTAAPGAIYYRNCTMYGNSA